MSLSKKNALANDTSAFRRTVTWCIVAAAIHVVIIGGVSAGQWMFGSNDAKPVANTPGANAGANASADNTVGTNATANNAANASGANNTPAANRPGNSRIENDINSIAPPPDLNTSGSDGIWDF